MGFHNKNLADLRKSKSGGISSGVEVQPPTPKEFGEAEEDSNRMEESSSPLNLSAIFTRKEKERADEVQQSNGIQSSCSSKNNGSSSSCANSDNMIGKKLKIIEDLEAFQQALPLFSSMEHHAVHIDINDDGEPVLFECVCGEEVLKEIQFLRHLIHSLGLLDLRSLSFFATSKIDNLTGGKKSTSGSLIQDTPPTSESPPPQAAHNSEETSACSSEPSLHHQQSVVEEKQDLSKKDAKAAVSAVMPSKGKVKKEKKKKHQSSSQNGSHSQTKASSPPIPEPLESQQPLDLKVKLKVPPVMVNMKKKRKQILKKHPKFYYWQNRLGHGVKVKISAGENEGKYVCYCGTIFKRLSSIDNHVNKKWQKGDKDKDKDKMVVKDKSKGKEKEYKCLEPGCSQVFPKKHQLKKHLRKCHKAKSNKAVLPEPGAAPIPESSPTTVDKVKEESSSTPVPPVLDDTDPSPSPGTSLTLRKREKPTPKATPSPQSRTKPKRHPTKKKFSAHHSGKKMKCEREGCNKLFITVKGLRLHIQAQHDKIPVLCPRCGMDVKYETCLLSHKRSNKCKPKPKAEVKEEEKPDETLLNGTVTVTEQKPIDMEVDTVDVVAAASSNSISVPSSSPSPQTVEKMEEDEGELSDPNSTNSVTRSP